MIRFGMRKRDLKRDLNAILMRDFKRYSTGNTPFSYLKGKPQKCKQMCNDTSLVVKLYYEVFKTNIRKHSASRFKCL